MKHATDLTQGSIAGHILRMTPAMAAGILAMFAFHLTDTWFISKLGTKPLAAMGFTFPVIMFIHSITMGIGIGASACISRAMGTGDLDHVKLLTTQGILAGFVVNLALTLVGWALMPVIFSQLGAANETLSLSVRYMRIWFLFTPIVAMPMVGNNAMRATGDTVRPAMIMSVAAALNAVLDPIFIFGWGPVPAMGLEGAAWATGIGRMLSLIWAGWILHFDKQILSFSWPGKHKVVEAWKELMRAGIPAASTQILTPVTVGLITRMVAQFGEHAVAATAAGQRIERFSYLVPMAMSTVVLPVVGQNWGAGLHARSLKAWRTTCAYGMIYAALCLGFLFIAGGWVASQFSREPAVVGLIARYLWLMISGSAFMHVTTFTAFALNAIDKPMHAAFLTSSRLLGLVIPLAWLGARLYGVVGIYAGITAANICGGCLTLLWFPWILGRARKETLPT